MKNNRFTILIALTALLLASLACNAVTGGGDTTSTGNESSTTVNISNAHMSLDANDTITTQIYPYDAPTFYCFFDLNNAPEGTVVTGTWILLSAAGFKGQQVIDSAEITGTDNTYTFSLDRTEETWPVGYYKIDLYINGTLVQSPGFEVK